MIQTEGITALYDVEMIGSVQNGEIEGTTNKLRRVPQSIKAQASILLDQLHGNIAVGLDLGGRQLFRSPQNLIITEDAIMRQRKGHSARLSHEGVIIEVMLFASLRGHAGVAHNILRLRRNAEVQSVGREWALIDTELISCPIGNAGGIRAPRLAGNGQNGQQLFLLPVTQVVPVIQNSKQAAHYSSASLSTGSFR